MVLSQALAMVRSEAARIAAIAAWCRANGASSANASFPSGPVVIYSDGSCKPAGAARVILGVN